jgi:putative serine protease PepD
VITASLLVGGSAGVGGAALWDATHDDAATTSQRAANEVSPAAPAKVQTGSIEEVAAKVLPSVVQIKLVTSQGAGSGSGIILTQDGQILTNHHVVEGADQGGRLTVSFNDGTTASATVVGTDPLTDTAVIKADGVSGLTPAQIGSSDALLVGQPVVAVGSPFGLDATVTSGIVSALDRPVNVSTDEAGNATTYPAIQTDAAINPGNSGGPLVDMNGDVVGINSSIRTASSMSGGQAGSIGLGFAIPIGEVLPIVEQMQAGETPTHARLGITVGDAASDAGVSGAVLRSVSPGGAAQDAGLRAGDVITSIDDTQITGADSLVATIRAHRPGDEVQIAYTRGGKAGDVSVTLESDAD